MKTLMIVALVLGQYSTDGPSQWDFTAPQEVAVEERKPAWPTWVAASKSGKPVVLFVNVEPRRVGSLTVACEDFFDGVGSGAGIVVAVPNAGGWFDRYDLPAEATDQQVLAASRRREEVRPSASPFARQSAPRDELLTADADRAIRSLRRRAPDLADYLATMEPYRRATMTQHTGRRVSGGISAKSRDSLEQKWNVPGGLVGVSGWRSSLFRLTLRPRVFLARQYPYSDIDAVTWYREYPDGAEFADVLSNTSGEVFEVRLAEKGGGEWRRSVAYKDRAARPAGYLPLKRAECNSCHSQAGVSAYDAAAVPGGDGVLSDPYEHLEAGQYVEGGHGLRLN